MSSVLSIIQQKKKEKEKRWRFLSCQALSISLYAENTASRKCIFRITSMDLFFL
jgi:hypothetical protein